MSDRDRILPRFWSIRDKEYIYWDCYMQTAFNRLIEPNTYGLMYNLYKDRVNCIPEMPTGLRDKNGKLIYEGDIILVEDNKCLVEWDTENARYSVTGYGEIAYLNYNEIEVIGNIHENKELLDETINGD